MKLKTVQSISNLTELPELIQFLSGFQQDVVTTLNGNLSLVDNTNGTLISVTFSAASTTVQVSHLLKRTPTGYIVAGRSANIQVFDGNQSNTTQFLYVQSSGAGIAKLYIF